MAGYRAIPEYYDAENEHHDWLAQDVPFLLQHMPSKSQRVLELAVGTARCAIPLAQAGHRVVGVDIDSRMLDLARSKRDSVGLSDRNLRLIQADACDLNLGERFDWVCILFNTFLSFTTLQQQDACLQGVRRHLKPRGTFWIDIFQPNPVILAEEHSHDLDPHVFYVPQLNRTVHMSTDVQCDTASQIQRVTFNYLWFDADGVEHRRQRKFNLTFMFPRELQLLLERNGFHIDQTFGDYDGSPLASHSPRIIASCRRRG
jgi:ubiquinone/menaquinone biosynthesis C-methylase UbiE